MKKLMIIIPTLILVPILSLIIVSPVTAITWGDPDTEHTNVGAIVVALNGDLYQMCSGTLIDEQLFLTAGHCTYYLENYEDIEDIYVTFDEDSLNPTELIPVTEIITHPGYDSPSRLRSCDLGILVLGTSVPDIIPAELATEGLLNDLLRDGKLRQGKEEMDFTVVGYGCTLEWPPPFLPYDGNRRVAESEYIALLKSWLILSQNQATGDGGTSYGDSGGPVFYEDPGGEEFLVALTSWGDTPCVSMGFYYRVDTPESLLFIDEIKNNL